MVRLFNTEWLSAILTAINEPIERLQCEMSWKPGGQASPWRLAPGPHNAVSRPDGNPYPRGLRRARRAPPMPACRFMISMGTATFSLTASTPAEPI